MKKDVIIGNRQTLYTLNEEVQAVIKRLLGADDDNYYINEKVVITIEIIEE